MGLIDVVYPDGSPVAKSAVRGDDKTGHRRNMATADGVRNTSLSGQYAGIYIRSLQSSFDLDTADTITADDGVNCVIDLDGNRFKRVPVDTSLTQRLVTAAGMVAVAFDDADIIVIDKTVAAATTVNLPSAALRKKSVRIQDGKGDADTRNITVVPVSGQKIYGIVDYQAVIDGNGGFVELTPRADGSGWF